MNTPADHGAAAASQSAWSQDEAIAFESARECITDWIAVLSSAIHKELSAPVPDAHRVAELEDECARLHVERSGLHVGDAERVAAVREKYGMRVRAWRSAGTTHADVRASTPPGEDDFIYPTDEERRAWARITSRPGAVGDDSQGRLVRVRADGTFEALQE